MAYTKENYQTKKALKQAVERGDRITCYQPAFGSTPANGELSVDGPHYPQPHKWYARVTLKDGYVIKVK